MDPDATPSTLDEIILALQPEVGEAPESVVLELSAADLLADGGEIVDLTNILGGGSRGGDLTSTLTELTSVEGGSIGTVSAVETTELSGHFDGASVLYAILSLSSDDPASN